MAIAFDSSADGAHTGGATSLSWAHNNTAGDIGIVGCLTGESTPPTATWDGNAMTRIATVQTHVVGSFWISLFYRLSPGTGSKTVVVNTTGSVQIYGLSLAYTGAQQSGQPGENGSDTTFSGSGNNTNVALTLGTDQSWIVCFSYDSDAPNCTAGALTTLRVTNADFGGIQMFDGGPFATGARNLTITPPGNNQISTIFASILPTAAAGGAVVRRLLVLGVGA